MISVTPQTSIVLCTVPWEEDYKNQRTFTNATAQASYFSGLSKKQILGTDFTYQRKDGYLTVAVDIESIRKYNYVYYTNTGYSNKIFYAFITDMQYVSSNSTRLKIETDVFQTWQFDLVYNKCFIEREHVSDDTIGLHTVPEALETGDYICNDISAIGISDTRNNAYCCLTTSYIPTSMSSVTNIHLYNGVYSGTYQLFFDTASYLSEFLTLMDKLSKADAITSLFMVPTAIVNSDVNFQQYAQTEQGETYTWECAVNTEAVDAKEVGTDTITMNSTLNGYTPKNNKLFCAPYNYFYLANNIGGSVAYKYEDFVNNAPEFVTVGAITAGCSIITYPLNYRKYTGQGHLNNYDNGIAYGKLPICSWASDVYVNWLTQNGLSLKVQAGLGTASVMLGGIMMSGAGKSAGIQQAGVAGAGMILGGVSAILNAALQQYEHSFIPPQAEGEVNSGDVCYSSNNTNMLVKKMSIRSEYAQIIDNFFEMFGYKVNMLKIPNITGRTYWNYVKTIDCNVEGDIPNEDLLLIRKMFDNGVTLWHTNDMYDYTKNNH